MLEKNGARVGVYICHCGVNIAATVDVIGVREWASKLDGVVVARDYKFMCSETGQSLIRDDIRQLGVNRVVVAACSPLMHETTFRGACEQAGLNGYLFQMSNIREQCSWVHAERRKATEKATVLINAAIARVKLHEPLETTKAQVNPATMILGGGIAGIQAALEIAEAGHPVILVEREPSVGGHMATFDKTFPTLDCSACILTPKMVSLTHRRNIRLLTWSEVESVSGYVGNFGVRVHRKARFVDPAVCTGCGQCWTHCPALRMPTRRAIKLYDRVIKVHDCTKDDGNGNHHG